VEGIEAAIARGGTQLLKCNDDAPPVNTTQTIVVDNHVTLDGQGNLIVQGDDGHLMFDVQPFDVELVGFTISRGNQAIRVNRDAALTLTRSVVKENTSTSAAGGGIFNDGALTLVDTTVERNVTTTGPGGGIYNSRESVLTLTNSKVLSNVSELGPGGGIQNNEGTVLVNASEIAENNAPAADGGGISNENGTVTIVDSIVRENTTRGFGGGLYSRGFSATMHITDSVVSGNRSTGDKHGGGIRVQHGELQSTRTTWVGNESSYDGGGLLIEGDDAVATLIGNTVSGNSATRVGGGIRVYENALVRIINSTIYDNNARDGGALHIDFGGSVEVRSSTISNNDDVGRFGTPIDERESAAITHLSGTLTFVQSILDDTCVVVGTLMSLDHNIESPADTCLLDGANDSVGVTPEELNLAEELANNGGTTQTLLLNRPSVAVDYLISTCEQPVDQRGVPRPQGSDCDIGALELE
jgi:hypothetical protein